MEKSLKIKLFCLDNIIWFILGGFVLICSMFVPHFSSYKNIINVLYHSSVLSMLVLAEGLTLMSGHFDLSIESTLAFAPAIGALVATKWLPGIHPIIPIFITFLTGAGIGLFNGLCVAKVKINPFLQTLSMLIILRGLVLFLIPFSISDLPESFIFLGGSRIVMNIPVAVFVMFIIYFSFRFVFRRTRYGRLFIATGGNKEASFIAGVNTERIITSAFILSGLLAAMAGFLVTGRQNAVTNAMGTNWVLLAFAGAVLGGVSLSGGKGTIMGILGGALFLGIIDNVLTLIGLNVFLVYATKGFLIFIAIVLDQFKTKFRSSILKKEELKFINKKFGFEKQTSKIQSRL